MQLWGAVADWLEPWGIVADWLELWGAVADWLERSHQRLGSRIQYRLGRIFQKLPLFNLCKCTQLSEGDECYLIPVTLLHRHQCKLAF